MAVNIPMLIVMIRMSVQMMDVMLTISYDVDNACTNDIFDAVTGVSHTLVDCDNNNSCTVDCCDVESGF